MLPAHQGFDADDDSAGKFDFRLVVDDELTAGDARPQLGGLSLSIGVERSPLGDVRKAHYGARHLTVDEKRCRGVLDWQAGPVLAPEDLVVDPALEGGHGSQLDLAGGRRVQRAILMVVMDQLVHLPAEHLFRLVAKHLGPRRIHRCAHSVWCDGGDAFSARGEEERVVTATLLARPQCQRGRVGVGPLPALLRRR